MLTAHRTGLRVSVSAACTLLSATANCIDRNSQLAVVRPLVYPASSHSYFYCHTSLLLVNFLGSLIGLLQNNEEAQLIIQGDRGRSARGRGGGSSGGSSSNSNNRGGGARGGSGGGGGGVRRGGEEDDSGDESDSRRAVSTLVTSSLGSLSVPSDSQLSSVSTHLLFAV